MHLFIVLIRPVGSGCWTIERIAPSREAADRYAAEERNKKIRFADASMHLQSTAIIEAELPSERDATQQHWEAHEVATVTRSVA
jgi:hypothetical protein